MKNKEEKNINEFVDRLNLYQSANSDPESIKNNFVIRVQEFDLIIGSMLSKKKNDSLQHELILGKRGSGKSTLLKRIEIEINENNTLKKKYIPINFAEEQAGIYRLSDLWYETFVELQNRFNLNETLQEFSEFENGDQYTKYLFNTVNSLLISQNKKAVLLIDNFDRILEGINEDAKMLRAALLNHNNIQIIGASTRISEHFWQYEKPFYDYFRQHNLKALSFHEIDLLFKRWSEIMKLDSLKDYATNNRGKIEAIRIMTDGLPRTLQFFIRILLTQKDIYGFQYIKKIMDKATPLYQERLLNLTKAQQKIVLELAFIWKPATTKELVNACRMESKLVSSYLKQLESFGLVDKLDTNKRNKKYRISERFFNMWLLVTQGNPEQKRRAKYLTVFLESWYDAKEIEDLAEEHLTVLKESKAKYVKAGVMTKALSQSKFISLDMRDKLIEGTLKLSDAININDLPRKASELLNKAKQFLDEKKYDRAILEIEKIENEADGVKFFFLGFINSKRQDNEQAEKYYSRAVKKGSVDAMNNLGFLYGEKQDYKNAEKYYLKAIEKRNVESYILLAALYFSQDIKPKKALDLIQNELVYKSKNKNFLVLKLIIEIWNGVFTEVDSKMKQIFSMADEVLFNYFLENLLYLEQKNLVLSYFESDKYGKMLKEKFQLIYYATQILCGRIEPTELEIPKEVLATVKDIVDTVKAKNKFYNN